MDRPSYGYSAQDGPDPASQPVCPRHPDRVTYISCKRCERPACPDCQRPTPVGVLCVDCDREVSRQQASTRPRNSLGGATGRRLPVVTYAIIALCVLGYIGQTLAPDIVFQQGAFAPFRALQMPWTFLTSGFLHGGILHLALNMYALWIVGQYLEQTMGHVRYAGLFLVSVLGGHTAVYLLASPLNQDWVTATVGASGGVFGLFASIFIVNRRMGAQTAQIAVLIGANLVITFLIPSISWQGHLGGLVVGGAATAAMFALRPKATPGVDRQVLARHAAVAHGAVLGGIALLLVALVLAKAFLVVG